MKKYFLGFLSIFLFFTMTSVKALTLDEIKSRKVCSAFEVAISKEHQVLETVACFDTYKDARNALNTDKSKDNLVILERKNNVTTIIDAKRALVYLGVRPSTENTNWYSDKNLTSYLTYMNHHPNYGATDGVFLELNYDNYAVKAISNGIVGWVKKDYYKIVPIEFAGNFNYYKVTDTEFKHFYSANIETYYNQPSRVIDKKPTMLSVGNYYSYDGIYFYKDIPTMISDYIKDTRKNSVNYKEPYYNYYMYLPHRARSNYTSDDIDAYLKNTKGLVGTVYGRKVLTHYSNMYATGIFFKSSENLYGANAIMMMSLATNESALGQSYISVEKNNLFGHAAYDHAAYDSATGYLNPYESIIGHANNYINCGYAKPSDWRYYGSHFGSKISGMNVNYASDPYWGEKAANYYYEFEKANGFLDYNYYQLGVTNDTTINVRTEPNTISPIPYTIKYQNIPVIILGEVTGTTVNGSNKWYKIVSDGNLNTARNSLQSCSYDNYYNWNSYVYVHSSYITKINKTSNGKYNNPNSLGTNDKNYTYKEYASSATYTPKVGLVNKDTKVYDTSTMTISTNKTMKKGHFTTVFMEALNEKKEVVAYLVTYDYSKNQRGWVKASDITISSKDILKVSLNTSGDYLEVYNEPNKNYIGNIYTDTYVTIVDTKKVNNDLWLKICYGIDNTFAWINTNISPSKGTLTYTTDKLNQKPVIKASDKTIYVNQSFNALSGVTATDSEDGVLTSKIKVTKNTVDTSKSGTYQVTYEVSDSKGLTTTKTIKVTVKNYTLGKSLFIYNSLKQISNSTFEFSGFLGVKKMNNTNLYHKLIFKNQQTNKTYTFTLDNYKDYPYEVSSLDDDKTYNYSDGWFKGKIDLSKLPAGDYLISIQAYNEGTGYYADTYFTNLAYLDMPRRVKVNSRGYAFDIDYSSSGSPLVLSIRDTGLVSYDVPNSFDPMYNFFTDLKVKDNTLAITGTSHNVGVSYSKKDTVKRELIFENTSNFKRYSYDVGYIDNGPYKVTLAVSDNKDKTRAWFKKEIDLSKLEKGTYAIYLKTTSNSKTYYGELVDIAYTDFTKINTSKYQFKRIDNKRLRVELTVK